MNARQHAPANEHPPGYHPSQDLDPALHAREAFALYSRWIRPGDLVFDIGANVGERTRIFLELGARVVAVEPQPDQAAMIPGEATVVQAACGAEPDIGDLFLNASSPYMASLSRRYVDQVEQQPGLPGRAYDPIPVPVEIITLDRLIFTYGSPSFVKIDVEGYEVEVLRGLTWPVPALSFEVHNFDTHKATLCFDWLDSLGAYRFLYSPLETFRLERWPPPELATFGDVYATLAP